MDAMAEDRELQAALGRVYSYIVRLDWTPIDARAFHGPAMSIKPSWIPESDIFLDRNSPLKITLCPDLSMDDIYLKTLAKLSSLDDLEVFIPPDLSENGIENSFLHMKYEQAKKSLENWHLLIPERNSRYGLFIQENAGEIAGLAFGGDGADNAFAMYNTARAHETLGSDLLVTRNRKALGERYKESFVKNLGIVTPKEALSMASTFLRNRDVFPTKVSPRFKQSTNRGSFYDGLTQLMIPSYLQLYGILARLGSKYDEARLYLEGILINCSQLLIALDRLAIVHYRENIQKANNDSVRIQQYEASNAILSITSACEGLTWLIVKLSGQEPNRLSVSFRKIREKKEQWIKELGLFEPTAEIVRANYFSVFEIVYALRHTLQHHMPISVAVEVFGKTARINNEPKFFEEFWMGVLLSGTKNIPPAGWPKGLPGIMNDGDEIAILPYPFFRETAFRLTRLCERTLNSLSIIMSKEKQEQALPFFFQEADTVLLSAIKDCVLEY